MGGLGTSVVQSPVAVHTLPWHRRVARTLTAEERGADRYWLWTATSAKFLIPFSLLVSLGSHLPWPSHAVAPKTTAYVAIEEMSQPFLQATAPNTPSAIPVAKPTASYVPIRILPAVLTAVWLIGFMAVISLWCAVAANLQISAVGNAVNRGTRG